MSHYSYVAIRSMLRRLGVLGGNCNQGFHCTICDKKIGSTNHFFFQHKEYYKRACEAIDKRDYSLILIEA